MGTMREVEPYEAFHYMWERYEEGDSVRIQDYEVEINHLPHRGILFNSGHAIVTRSAFTHLMGEVAYESPKFFIITPPARGEAR